MLFVGVLIYVGVHKKVIEALDDRSTVSRRSSMRPASFVTKPVSCSPNTSASSSEAEREAEAIVADAKAEAGRVAAEARVKMEEFVARRTKLAETKISQAEAQALADVRAAAADAAVAAAEKILRDSVKGQIADGLIAQGIADVKAKLN